MGLSQELSRHAIKRASALDVAAVARGVRREGGREGAWVGGWERGKVVDLRFVYPLWWENACMGRKIC